MRYTTHTESPAGRHSGFRLGFALSFAIAALAASPTSITFAKNNYVQGAKESKTLNYPIKGEHVTKGAFEGTLTATFTGDKVVVTQTMNFVDGTSDSITIRCKVKNNRVAGRVTESVRGTVRGAIQALEGQQQVVGGSVELSRILRVKFDGQSVRTRLLEGQRRKESVTASASGELLPELTDQGVEDKETLHHQTQGVNLLPKDWFLALEQAGSEAMFKDPDHMGTFGFLDDEGSELPIGFAIQGAYVGLNCAACHTSEIKAFGSTLRIEGGRANVDIGMFRKALGGSLAITAKTPAKFQRFAARVLAGQEIPISPEAMKGVGEAVKQYLLAAQKRAQVSEQLGLSPVKSGPGRVDAYGNGANAIFGPLSPSNLKPAVSPVRMPFLWGTANFAWVQYNAAIRLPLARNLIASIAAGAKLAILDAEGNLLPEEQRWESPSRATDLLDLESAMAQIQAPKWPGYIDAAAAKRGGKLYQENCTSCHDGGRWTRTGGIYGERLLELPLFSLDEIGTDPNQVRAFQRPIDASAIGLGNVTFPEGLKYVSDQILAKQGFEVSQENDIRAPSAYRARPLDGIWAGAPYLHNGSVLTMDELLGAPSDRRTSFKLSTQPELDSKRLGFVEPAEGFEFDTSQPGNSNRGHEFRNARKGTKGVIGRALSEQERCDLIEFLKTL